MLKIEDNIPVPKRKAYKYPFNEMEVGQSVFIPKETHNRIRSHAEAHHRRVGYKYLVRSVTEDDVKGVRVWRVE